MKTTARLLVPAIAAAFGIGVNVPSLRAADAPPAKPAEAPAKVAAGEKPAEPDKPMTPDKAAPPEKLAMPDKPAAPARPVPLKPAERMAVQTAANALLLEYGKAMKEKKGELPREKSDYFPEAKPAGVTPETVLDGLAKRHSSDPRADAYVKWQLLSGISGQFPPELKSKALAAYQAAPRPPAHPGLGKMNLDRALNRVGIMKKEAEGDINKEYSTGVSQYLSNIDVILEYRDELYARLPVDFDTYVAGLNDVYERVTAGAPANEAWGKISAALRGWAITAKDPKQVMRVAGVITKLRETNKDDRNRPYAKVTWTDQGLKWSAESPIRDDKSLEETAAWLAEQAKNPGGGLGFKDPTEKKK
ncbi:MAG: hypothetical protein ACAI43_13595 [Phycisphaerae bacterium]